MLCQPFLAQLAHLVIDAGLAGLVFEVQRALRFHAARPRHIQQEREVGARGVVGHDVESHVQHIRRAVHHVPDWQMELAGDPLDEGLHLGRPEREGVGGVAVARRAT